MEKISFEVIASDVTTKPEDYRNIRVEVDGVDLSDLVSTIDDNAQILKVIGVENIAEWIAEESNLTEMLDYFDDGALVDYLKSQGWEFNNDSSN